MLGVSGTISEALVDSLPLWAGFLHEEGLEEVACFPL